MSFDASDTLKEHRHEFLLMYEHIREPVPDFVHKYVERFLEQLCPPSGWKEDFYKTCGEKAVELDCKIFKDIL